MVSQLVDRSFKTPRGLVEEVLVKVGTCYFLVDFLILDMEPSQNLHHSPIILGRPFLATANANINCKSGLMDISFGDQKVTLNVFRTSKTLREEEDCYTIDMIDGLTEDSLVNNEAVEYNDNPLEEFYVDPGIVQPSESQTIWSTKVEPLPDLDVGSNSPATQTPP